MSREQKILIFATVLMLCCCSSSAFFLLGGSDKPSLTGPTAGPTAGPTTGPTAGPTTEPSPSPASSSTVVTDRLPGGTTPSASNGGTTPSAYNGGTTPNTEPVVPFADCKYETIVSNFCNQRCGGGRKTITYKILSEGTGGGASCTDTFKYLPKEESCNTFPCPSSATCKAQGQNSGTCRNFPGCVEDDDGRCCLDSERNEEGEESSMICRW